MKYTLGLDLGIASVGWAILEHKTSTKSHIVDCGVRIFDTAEVPKTGGSLAEGRRKARGQRRTLRRRKFRLLKTKELLVKYGLVRDIEQISAIFSVENKVDKNYYNVYYLRTKALDYLLTNSELVQVLVHLVKHRGFKSNRKKDTASDGKANKALKQNEQLFEENGYRTVGEMLEKHENFKEIKRNKAGDYKIMLYRKNIEDEARLILKTQMKLGNSLITEGFIEEYLKRLTSQKSFDYKGNIREMVGNCQFEPDEKRASRATLSSLKFIAYSRMNNIRIEVDGREEKLTSEQMDSLWNNALCIKSGLNFSHVRKIVGDDQKIKFNYVDYDKTGKNKVRLDYKEAEKNTKIRELELKEYHEFKSVCIEHIGDKNWNILVDDVNLYDKLASEITYSKDDELIGGNIKKVFETINNKFDSATQDKLVNAIVDSRLSFSGNISLSTKALNKIIPYLENGYRYDEACNQAGYHHSQLKIRRQDKLPSLKEIGLSETITNPVVLRALSQMRKVVNALVAKYGAPYQINVELARDIGKDSKERKAIGDRQKLRQKYNQSLFNEFKQEFGKELRGATLERYKLWKQQDGKCLYSLEPINPDEAIFENFCQVDHIIPWSRSYDDSLDNKALVKTFHNQNKTNQTPFEYLGGDENNWHKLTTWWQNLNKTYYQQGFTHKKLKNLMIKKFEQEEEMGFKDRNLNDTRFIAKETAIYLQQYLKFSDENNKKPVRVLNGGITAYLRLHWGLVPKDRNANDLHHAQDACVIAATTESMVNLITRYSLHKNENNNAYIPKKYTYTDAETGEVFTNFPVPNNNFRNEVIELVSRVFVSRMPRHKISGAVNDDTVRSLKYVEKPVVCYNNGKPFSTVRKPLAESKIELNSAGDIDGICPTYKQHNPKLYELIRDRLKEYGGDCSKAFAKGTPPLYAPYNPDKFRTDKEKVIVKNIKVVQQQNTGVRVRQGTGIAGNGKIIRADIFSKNGKSYMVLVYESDVVELKLPNRAVVAHKDEKDWLLIDQSYQFMFSLYSNDFVIIRRKKGEIAGYVQSFDRSTGVIKILKHDGSSPKLSYGIQSVTIEKYNIDVLGNKNLVKSEKRLEFNVKNKKRE